MDSLVKTMTPGSKHAIGTVVDIQARVLPALTAHLMKLLPAVCALRSAEEVPGCASAKDSMRLVGWVAGAVLRLAPDHWQQVWVCGGRGVGRWLGGC
jgi:hypothetical protein